MVISVDRRKLQFWTRTLLLSQSSQTLTYPVMLLLQAPTTPPLDGLPSCPTSSSAVTNLNEENQLNSISGVLHKVPIPKGFTFTRFLFKSTPPKRKTQERDSRDGTSTDLAMNFFEHRHQLQRHMVS